MSELRSFVEHLSVESLAELTDARLEEDFAELHRALELLEVERLRRLAEIERRRLFERDGHPTTAAWLVETHRVGWGSAREQARTARALEEMPHARGALESSDVSLSSIRVLVGAREADPSAFARDEATLVEAARTQSVGELRHETARWRERVERSLDPEEIVRARRRLDASVSYLGMVRVDGDLDPESGETLLTALRAVIDAESRGRRDPADTRSPAQRRADALAEICRQWLDRLDRPMVAGERPHVTLTVAASELGLAAADKDDGAASPAELDHAGAVSQHTARRLTCDASLMRVVTAGRSEPLDVGRRMKVVPPAMRRAVVVRDRTCRFPGCDRPHPWCDAHHVVHWADGGSTATSNLILLCRHHHRLIHRPNGFRLELADGRPRFRRPDGSLLEDRAPP